MTPEEARDSRTRVLPLVADAETRASIADWIDEHPTYDAVDVDDGLAAVDFDVCIIDQGAFAEHGDALQAKKAAAAPVLLPALLLLPEAGTDPIGIDADQAADTVVTKPVDDLVTLPVQEAELHWRLDALVRLREQSLTLRARERELERQVDLFERAQDIADVGAWEYDVAANEVWWTDEVRRIHGLPEDTQPSLEESLSFYHPADRPVIEDAFEAAVDAGEPYDLELRLLDAAGNRRWVRTRGEPQYENGEVVYVRGTIQDITDRKERDAALERRTQAVDEAPIGISITDPTREDNPLIYVNDAFVEMTGYPRAEALGENCRFLQGENTDPDRVARLRAAIDAEEPVAVELRNYRKDGTEFWNHLEIAPVRNDAGEVVNYVGFQQDVTERKDRQRQLETLDRVLRHNMRNDINVIRGHAQTMASERADGRPGSPAAIIEKSEQLLGLAEKQHAITELLRETPTRTTLDVGDVLRTVRSNVGSEHPNATIDIDCPDAVTVRATRNLPRAIRELVTNAIIHHDSSSPRVAITVTRTADAVRIAVADTGPRIPEMERELLVDGAVQTPLYHGSGLGLWLVRLITTRSGGTITTEENTPTGNVVRLEFPRRDQSDE